MRWHRSLLLLALLAGRAPAQDVRAAANQADPVVLPTFTAPVRPDGPAAGAPCQTGCLAESPADRLSGNHQFAGFINWMSNPAYNIDPRAVTALYPVFLSTWARNTAPIPDANFQVYGAAATIALSDRFAMGLNQGGYTTIN